MCQGDALHAAGGGGPGGGRRLGAGAARYLHFPCTTLSGYVTQEEAEAVTGEADPAAAGAWVLGRPGCATSWAAIKLGPGGALLCARGAAAPLHIDALRVSHLLADFDVRKAYADSVSNHRPGPRRGAAVRTGGSHAAAHRCTAGGQSPIL